MSDETTHPDVQDDDFEAHGLKEGIAIALGAGALAAGGAAQAYVAPVDDHAGRVADSAPAKSLSDKAATKKKAAKKRAARASVPGGFTSPKKAPLAPDA